MALSQTLPDTPSIRVIFAANHTLDVGLIANHALQQLIVLPMQVTILLRRPRDEEPAAFETLISELCATMSIPVEWRQVEREHGSGRSATYSRDVEMARSADAAYCWFDPETPMGGGTGHLAERCIEEEVPITAWVYEDDEMRLLGSLEPGSV